MSSRGKKTNLKKFRSKESHVMYSMSKQHTGGNVKDSAILKKKFVQSLRVKKNIQTHQSCDAVEEKDTERGRWKGARW
jgi:hypothetical protein